MSGIKHWRVQRYSAVALIPLSAWLFINLFQLGSYDSLAILSWLSYPMNALLFALCMTIGLYHGFLGVEVVAEDYIAEPGRKTLLVTIKALLFILWFGLILSLITTI